MRKQKQTDDPFAKASDAFAQTSDPFASLSDAFDEESEKRKTIIQQRQADYESSVRLVESAKAAMARPDITPERKALLQRVIEANKPESILSLGKTKGESLRRFGGGVLAAIPGMALGATDLIATIPQQVAKIGAKVGTPGTKTIANLLTKGRGRIAEATAGLEDITGAHGLEGLVGQIAGSFGTGALGAVASKVPALAKVSKVVLAPAELYGRAAQTVGRVVPVVGKVVASEKRLVRMAGTALADLPINVLQGATQEGATPESIAKQVALGTATSAVGGGFTRAGIPKPKLSDIIIKAPPEAAGKPITGFAAEALAEGTIKAEARKAKSKLISEARNAVRKEWAEANPGKSWKTDISSNERAALIKNYIDQAEGTQGGDVGVRTAGIPDGVRAEIVDQAGIDVGARIAELEKRLQQAEFTDKHTGLGNKAGYNTFSERIAKGDIPGEYEHVYIDLGNFKGLNDVLGHEAGDIALTRVADAMRVAAENVGADSRNVFRHGGDEFTAIVPKGQGKAFGDAVKSIVGELEVAPGKMFGVDYGVGHDFKSAEGVAQAIKDARKVAGRAYRTDESLHQVDPSQLDLINDPSSSTLLDMPQNEFELNYAAAIEENHPALPEYQAVAKIRGIAEPTGETGHPLMHETWGRIRDPNMSPEEATQLGQNLRDMSQEELNGFDHVYRHIKGLTSRSTKQETILKNLEIVLGQAIPRPGTMPAPRMEPRMGALPPGRPAISALPTSPLEVPPGRTPDEFLTNVPHDKPLSQMTGIELDDVKEQLWTQIEQHPQENIPPELMQDLDRVAKATVFEEKMIRESTPNPEGYKAFVKEVITPTADEPLRIRPEYNDMQIVQGKPVVRPVQPDMTSAEFGKLVRMPEKKLTLDQAQGLLTELEMRTASMARLDAQPYVDKMNKLRSAIAEMIDPPPTSGGIVAYTRGETVGAIAGFMYGMTVDDDPQEAMKYAVLFGLVGAVGAHGAVRVFTPKSRVSVVPDKMLSSVKTEAELSKAKSKPTFFETMRNIYQKNVRPALGGELFMKDISQGRPVPPGADVGKALASYGKHLAHTEAWISGRPFWENPDGSIDLVPALGQYTDKQGNPVPIYNAHDVIKAVEGDVEGLGKFAAARTALEIFKNKGKKTTGIDLMEAARLVSYMESNQPNYVAAADAARQFHLSLLEGMVRGEVISREAKDAMGQEQFYAALERAFGQALPGGEVGKKKSGTIMSPNPVKERTGGADVPIKNPIETMVANIVRVQRAIEINRLKNMAVDAMESNPDIGKHWLSRIDRNKRDAQGRLMVDEKADIRVQQLRNDLNITEADAKSMTSNFTHEPMDPTSPTMTLYRGGVLRTYRLEGALATSFRALSPPELNDILKSLGMVTNIARAGIVKNPVFIARQAWRDNWQAMLNSQYGFVWGLDWWKGFYELARYSDKAKEFQRHGGGHTSLSFSDVLTPQGALTTAKDPGRSALDASIKRIKELKIGEAYRALMIPMAEAARMGEYLRAHGRGTAPQEAVFAAKSVVGNFQQTSGTLRALNQMALFVGPSVQALDQAVQSAGLHPFRPAPEAKGFRIGNLDIGNVEGRKAAALNYFVKGFVAIALPSLALRQLYSDDKEIMELSQSEQGRGFWFYRINGEIHKSAKPIFEGQIFGTSAEMAFDTQKGQDPSTVGQWAKAMYHDAAVNLLPLLGTVPFSLWANKDYNFGGPIVGSGLEEGSPEFQVNPQTSIPARVIGKALAPVSNALQSMGANALARSLGPAGIDYIVRNLGGTLAGDAMQGVSQAIAYKQTGMIAPKEEWPVIRGALVKYPSLNVASVQEFYDNADRVARVGHDVATLTEKSDPVGLLQYIQQHQSDVMKVELYTSARKDLADMRQAIQDMKDAPPGTFSPESIRQFERQIVLQMIETARIINTTAALIK